MLTWFAVSVAWAATPKSIDVDDVSKVVGSRRGQVTLVHVWATWCGVCHRVFDDLDDLAAANKSRGLTVLSMAIDTQATPVQRFLANRSTAFADYHVRGGATAAFGDEIDDLGGTYRRAVPYDLLLDADGRVLDEWSGALSASELDRRITRHLGSASIASSAEIAAIGQGLVRLALPGREGDRVFVDGWEAGVLPLETELCGGLHTFRVDGPAGELVVERAIEFGGGEIEVDLTP